MKLERESPSLSFCAPVTCFLFVIFCYPFLRKKGRHCDLRPLSPVLSRCEKGESRGLMCPISSEGHGHLVSAHSLTPFCLFSWCIYGALPFLWNPRRFYCPVLIFAPLLCWGQQSLRSSCKPEAGQLLLAGNHEQARGASSPHIMWPALLTFSLSPPTESTNFTI